MPLSQNAETPRANSRKSTWSNCSLEQHQLSCGGNVPFLSSSKTWNRRLVKVSSFLPKVALNSFNSIVSSSCMEPLIALKCSNSRVISCALTVVERKLERSLTIRDTNNALLSPVHLFRAAANLALFWPYLGGAFPPQAPFRKSKRVLPFLPDRFSSQCSLWCLRRSEFFVAAHQLNFVCKTHKQDGRNEGGYPRRKWS